MNGEPVALWPIVRAYALAQVAVVFLQFVLLLFGVDVGSGSSLGGSFVAAMFAANVFVKNFGRAPTAEERQRLVWLSFGACCVISLMIVGLVAALTGPAAVGMAVQTMQSLPTPVFIVIVMVVCGLFVGVLHLAYGPMARNFEKKLAVKRS